MPWTPGQDDTWSVPDAPGATGVNWEKLSAALGRFAPAVGGLGGGGGDDSKYLRIGATSPPTNLGNQGLPQLLTSLLQMHAADALARYPQSRNSSLLGN